MEKAVVELTEDQCLRQFRDCEGKIRKACLRGRDLTREIAQQLIVIRENELWRAVKIEYGFECRNFGEYVEHVLGWEQDAVNRYMRAEATFALLQAAKLSLPENESQAIALASLNDERQPDVWKRVIDTAEKHQRQITVVLVRQAVEQEQEEQRAEKAARAKSRGIKVDMGDDGTGQLSLSERGEEALARIRAICGDEVADSLLDKTVSISEEALRLWGEQEDADTVKNLEYYVINKGWKVRKALNYMSNLIDGDTTIDELMLMARDRKGQFSGTVDDVKITATVISS